MKRKVNSELNLSPMIDLFSMLTVFVILNFSLSGDIFSLSTNTSDVTSSDSAPVSDQKKVSLTVTIFTDRIQLSEDSKTHDIFHINDEIDRAQFVAQLNTWKTHYPDRKDVIVNSDNRIPYRHLISVFDSLVGNDWRDVGVNPQ